MLKEGENAPDLTLLDDAGGAVSLKDFRGSNLILYFFPKAMTPG